jgi:hypothetical protein
MVCVLLGVLTALLLKFRVSNTTEMNSSSVVSSKNDHSQTTWAVASDTRDNAYTWARVLGYKTGSCKGLPCGTGDTSNPVQNFSQPSLIEQNRVAIPLGVGIFAISLFVLGSSTYGYQRTHMQLAKGIAFAGSWRYVNAKLVNRARALVTNEPSLYRLESSMTLLLAGLLLAAAISFLVVREAGS